MVLVVSRRVVAHPQEELTVALDANLPGYFEVYGQEYGYQYEILKAYADHLGRRLKVVPFQSGCGREAMPDVDMAAVPTLGIQEAERDNSIEIYSTSYVLMARSSVAKAILRSSSGFDLPTVLAGKNLIVPVSFRSSPIFGDLCEALNSTMVIMSEKSSIDLIESLSAGSCDFMVCEKSEAMIGSALTRGIDEIFEFSRKMPMSIVVNRHSDGLKDDFEKWFGEYRRGEEYAMLNCLYFDEKLVGQLIAHDNGSEISMFDKLIRRVSRDEGYDWRLISAIAYSESQFDPYLTSPKGARGLMQVMPSVARQFNVKVGEMMDPEVNLKIATRLLRKIERSLRVAAGTPAKDRISMVLASYNCGLGHVIDARNLARKYGGNPDSWEDVSRYLELKADPLYTEDEVVKCGYFGSSGQTQAYVDKVMRKYSSYCSRFSE